MKKIILTLLMFVSVISLSQTTTEVVSVDSTLTKSNLYSNALAFFALEFKSANNVIQMKDAETGKVIGKGIVDDRSITITISCKDGKYKYDIDIEPFKNVIPTDINLNINKFGMYNGETKGTLVWVNGQAQISNVRFIYGIEGMPRSGNDWVVYQNGSGTPALMGGAYKKWSIIVSEQLIKIKKEYIDVSNPNEDRNKIIISNLVDDLKREMSKKSW